MKILITSLNGHLSKPLIKKLVNEFDKNIIILSRSRVNNFKEITISHDLSKSSFKIPNSIKCIIHTASVTPRSNNKIYSTNIAITKNLITSINNHGKIEKLINFSSMAIFDSIQKSNIVDDCSNNFSNEEYAFSKKLSEDMFLKSNSKKIYNIRIPGVLVDKNSENFISNLIKNSIINKTIVLYNRDNLFNNIMSVCELYNFIIKLLKNNYDSGNILLGSKNPASIEKIVNFIIDKLNKNQKILWKTDNKGFYINLNKTIKEYDYKPNDTIQIIDKYINKNFIN